jgi:hypothetical protein
LYLNKAACEDRNSFFLKEMWEFFGHAAGVGGCGDAIDRIRRYWREDATPRRGW